MKLTGWLIIGGIAAIGTGLGLWIKTQIDKLKGYDYDVKKIKIKTLSKDKLVLTIDYWIKNPSDISIDIVALIFDIRLNGHYIGQVKQDVNQRIAANGESIINIDADMTLKNIIKPLELAKLLQYYLTDKSKIIIGLSGSAVVKHSFIKIAVPVDNLEYKLTELV